MSSLPPPPRAGLRIWPPLPQRSPRPRQKPQPPLVNGRRIAGNLDASNRRHRSTRVGEPPVGRLHSGARAILYYLHIMSRPLQVDGEGDAAEWHEGAADSTSLTSTSERERAVFRRFTMLVVGLIKMLRSEPRLQLWRIGDYHIWMFLNLVVMIPLSVLLGSCTAANGLTSLAVINIFGQSSASALQVSVGYFGICVTRNSTVQLCHADSSTIVRYLDLPLDSPERRLLEYGIAFKDDVLFPYLLILAITFSLLSFLLLSKSPNWKLDKRPSLQRPDSMSDLFKRPLPSRPLYVMTWAFQIICSMILLAAAVWQHVGAIAVAAWLETGRGVGMGMHAMAQGWTETVEIGTGAMALVWVGFGCSTVASVWIYLSSIGTSLLGQTTNWLNTASGSFES